MDFHEQITESGAVILTLPGRLDATVAGSLKNAFKEQEKTGKTLIILDLAQATFIDSSAIGAMVGGLKGILSKGGDIRIACPSKEVRFVFEITRLHKVFSLYDSLEDALQDA